MHARLKRVGLLSAAAWFTLAAALCPAGKPEVPVTTEVGGANASEPAPPPKLVIDTAEIKMGDFTIRVPTGTYTAPKGGADNYTVPGPIVAFKGVDGTWRGHGYLETYPRLMKFKGSVDSEGIKLVYTFEKGKSYKVTMKLVGDAVVMKETSDLGPRNLYVFDSAYNWQPGAGFAVSRDAKRHAFVYMPCFYDKPEVTIRPADLANTPLGEFVIGPDGMQFVYRQSIRKPAKLKDVSEVGRILKGLTGPMKKIVVVTYDKDVDEETRKGVAEAIGAAEFKMLPRNPDSLPAAAAVVSDDLKETDVAGFFCINLASWDRPDRMGIQMWQRRQLPGQPASRHFLGPETKSDSTPNPRTADMLGKSLYEGHVTIEMSLGNGSRTLGFAVTQKGKKKSDVPEQFKKVFSETLKEVE
ncbi:MAG: hypothetical protein ACLFVU_13235 [Phycisphaerae bacterium]